MTANPFGWAVDFYQKQKQLKAQPKVPLILGLRPNFISIGLDLTWAAN
jgi:hypothetical protein